MRTLYRRVQRRRRRAQSPRARRSRSRSPIWMRRSKDYGEIKDKFRPGHADYTYFTKYGLRDGAAPAGPARGRPPTGWPPAPSRGKWCRA